MGIRIEQPGAAKAAATAGATIGKAERAKEDRARAEREQARAQAEATQRAAQQKAMEFELFKMEQRSAQDFQQELRDRQYGFERFNRAKEWDIEKMELASRMDFEMDEKERIRDIERKQNIVNAYQKEIDEGRADAENDTSFRLRMYKAQTELDAAKGGYKTTTMPAMPKEPRESEITKRTDVDAAIEFLQEYEKKKTTAEKWTHPFAPKPTKEEDVAAEYYRDILEQTTPVDTNVERIEPQSLQDFESTVSQLKAVDMVKARAYYDKWARKF